MRVLFAHGFEGGPSGSKPTYMREVLGWEVTSPIMSGLGWDIESQTKVLLRCIDEHDFDFIYHPSEVARSGVVARVTSAAGRGRGRGSRRLRGQSKI